MGKNGSEGMEGKHKLIGKGKKVKVKVEHLI